MAYLSAAATDMPATHYEMAQSPVPRRLTGSKRNPMRIARLCAVATIALALATGSALAAMGVGSPGGPLGFANGGPLGSPANPLGVGSRATGSAQTGMPGSGVSGFAPALNIPKDTNGVISLGVDLSRAGSTPETQLSYFSQLSPSKRTAIMGRCIGMSGTQTAATNRQVASFCQTLLGR